MYDLINCSRSNEPFAASPCGGLCLHVHGLAFETSIWLLAGSTRYIPSAAPQAGPRPPGCGLAAGPLRASPGPASHWAPSLFVGGHAASAWSGRLRTPGRVSPRLGGVSLGLGRGPSWPWARLPAPGLCRPRLAGTHPRFLLVHTFGAPAPPRVKPWHAPRYCQAAYCDSDKGVRPVGHSQRASPGTAAPVERHLQVMRRPPLASRPGPVSMRRRTGTRIRMPHGRPPLIYIFIS